MYQPSRSIARPYVPSDFITQSLPALLQQQRQMQVQLAVTVDGVGSSPAAGGLTQHRLLSHINQCGGCGLGRLQSLVSLTLVG
jgi:hypothetical protein